MIDKLLEKIRVNCHNVDIEMVKKAYYFAEEAHKDQKRESGEPYIIHPVAVAEILAEMGMDTNTIVAGLLHDVIEDTDCSYEETVTMFNEQVANLVDGVTKLTRLGEMEYKTKEEQQADNVRKMLLAMAKDIRVIIIKLADRLHNLRTLKFMPAKKQKSKAKETLNIYAPLAHRLGISKIKWELEDLCFRYLHEEEYYQLVKDIAEKRVEREAYIKEIVDDLKKQLESSGIDSDIEGRPKHFYSIYKKMVNKNKSLEQIFDLTAIRVLVNSVKDCYGVLGIVHTIYTPIPGRFKDYIAMPKPNMYQSLHTSVIGEKGYVFEIQIRTEEMDELAERGVASHWRYKEGKKYNAKQEQKEIGEKLQWMSEFITVSDEMKDNEAKDFYNTLQRDIFEANVYALTPAGRIVELPNGSTPIDFAYRVHTEVGHHAVGAIVNGVMVPFDTKLKTGDIVEIKTNKNSGPSEGWLKFVRTAGARNKIRQYITKHEEENKKQIIEEGRRLLRDEIRARQLDEKTYMSPDTYRTYLGSFGANTFDDVLFALGKKHATASTLLDKVAPQKRGFFDNLSQILRHNNNIQELNKKHEKSIGVAVTGVDGLKMQLSKCCNPIPGDKIVGFVSKGQGIKIHRADCPNVKSVAKGRLIDVYWDYPNIEQKRFNVDLEVVGLDRPNLLSDIVTCLSQVKVNILKINANIMDLDAHIRLTLSVENAEILQNTIDNMNKVQGVAEIRRVIH